MVWTPVKLEEQLELIGPDKHLLITEEAYKALGRFPATLEDFERILRARVTDVNYMVVVRQFADHAASMLQQ